MSTIDADMGASHNDDESSLAVISNTGNQQLARYVSRQVPHGDSFWQDFDETIFRLSKRFDALLLFRNYKKVMAEHQGWRDKIYKAAVILSEAVGGGRNNIIQFSWALFYICLAVKKVAAAIPALEKKTVDLSNHFQQVETIELTEEDLRLAEEVGEAMDQDAGMKSKDAGVAVALVLALFNDDSRESLLRQIRWRTEGGTGNAAPEFQLPAGPILMQLVAKHGRQVLKERMQFNRVPDWAI